MYSTFERFDVSGERLTEIVYFVIGVLIKYKNVETSQVDIDTLPSVPSGGGLDIAHELLNEMNADELIDNDEELDKHIQSLYDYLRVSLERTLHSSDNNGALLLQQLREMGCE